MKRNGLRMMESPVQGQLARRVRWGGCGNVHSERNATRRVLTQSLCERRDAYDLCVRRHPNYYDEETRKRLSSEHAITYNQQQNDLPEIKAEIRPEYQDIAAHVLQDVLRRLDKALTNFFRRCREGAEEPGFPRFKGRNWYTSFTYPDGAGWKLEEHSRPPEKKGKVSVNLRLSKIGTLKLHLHRSLEGKIKTLTVKKEGAHWYAVFCCEIARCSPLPSGSEEVGIDLGVSHLATLSTGEMIEHPRYYRRARKTLERRQQALARKKRGSHRRDKARALAALAHRKIANQRRDFLQKQSHALVKRYQLLVFEDIKVGNLTRRPRPKPGEQPGEYLPNGAAAKAGLNTSILDAGWGLFVSMCEVKAASAGRTLLKVDPKYTSQICSQCGVVRKKKLSERWHECDCGVSLDRDVNAAINILARGRKQLSGSEGANVGLGVEASCL